MNITDIGNNRRLFTIDSSKRTTSEPVGRFNFDFGSQVGKIKAVVPRQFDMYLTQYNVNQWNNVFKITYLATTYTITLTQGYYSSTTTLAAEIKSKLDACGSTLVFTVSMPTTTGLTTIATTANYTLIMPTYEVASLLGFVMGGTYTGASTYTGSIKYNLTYLLYYTLDINSMGISQRIRNTALPGNILMWQPPFEMNIANSPRNGLSSVLVTLIDNWGHYAEDNYMFDLEIF
jgi:hypothetical protein